MRSSSDGINVAASAQKLDVDNRISLRYYYRIADNILKQADIFRRERNIIDLYVMLLRFSSLVSETIPNHRDYKASLQSQKAYLKKRFLSALAELEKLKPAVQLKITELNRKDTYQVNGRGQLHQNNSLDWSPVKKQTSTNYDLIKAAGPATHQLLYQGSRAQQYSYARPVEQRFSKMSLGFPRPKEETLSRHSILGPNWLSGHWHPPISDKGVRYPSTVDLTPVEIPSLQETIDDGLSVKTDSGNSKDETSSVELILAQADNTLMHHVAEPGSLISFEPTESPAQPDIIRQPSPPPVLAEVQDLVPAVSQHNCSNVLAELQDLIPAVSSQVNEVEHGMGTSPQDNLVGAESPLQLHISTTMMETFMKLAKSNTDRNLETCGVLAGSLKNRKFYITALIIPKQESTSDSCQATNEEEIFEVQDKQSLFPLGWIHTHPSQSCFMSSIDVHTHYSYQIMLPESVAIVMAPRDGSRKHGIFRLTTPGGMSVIRQCQQRGFHPHDPPPDGGPIYKTCTDVYMNPKLKFEVIDLR
ncbi:AMSH-like ubiquitin thioesterase 1 [Juglans microcarpa x Juglans regia]|uniref:AMSH-like ubiquitin thioesterase 1 n=1 Tax=Juglans microcarpa x Juglans regia TaxID=2249226 RepID=UPI001B7F1E60|nr:AMSH-like ubiquitin thioesterase 1 [Juglans microcarpa x Juglans regia]XP_040996459.1 AMSH-like ubiquitin thioesterase 1 [Juglans microcarpa x Juglans regia]